MSAQLITTGGVTRDQLEAARKDYGDFIKFVVDVELEKISIGGEWHLEGEELLIKDGSKQANLWGGGVDLVTKEITFSAMTNIKPGVNSGHIILSEEIRKKIEELVRMYF